LNGLIKYTDYLKIPTNEDYIKELFLLIKDNQDIMELYYEAEINNEIIDNIITHDLYRYYPPFMSDYGITNYSDPDHNITNLLYYTKCIENGDFEDLKEYFYYEFKRGNFDKLYICETNDEYSLLNFMDIELDEDLINKIQNRDDTDEEESGEESEEEDEEITDIIYKLKICERADNYQEELTREFEFNQLSITFYNEEKIKEILQEEINEFFCEFERSDDDIYDSFYEYEIRNGDGDEFDGFFNDNLNEEDLNFVYFVEDKKFIILKLWLYGNKIKKFLKTDFIKID